jgi:hypothetical protein
MPVMTPAVSIVAIVTSALDQVPPESVALKARVLCAHTAVVEDIIEADAPVLNTCILAVSANVPQLLLKL